MRTEQMANKIKNQNFFKGIFFHVCLDGFLFDWSTGNLNVLLWRMWRALSEAAGFDAGYD